MCSPILASTALGVASSALQIQGQAQMAKTQAAYQRQASEQENKRLAAEQTAVRIRQAQEQVAKAQRITAITKEAEKKRATAIVSSAEAGVAGLSVDALENSITSSEGQAVYALGKQQEFADVARQFSFENSQVASEMNQIRINKPINQTDFAGSLLSGARTGLSIYGAIK